MFGKEEFGIEAEVLGSGIDDLNKEIEGYVNF